MKKLSLSLPQHHAT